MDGFMPKRSRGGIMKLQHSASVAKSFTEICRHEEKEEEGCTDDSSGLHVDVPLFADVGVSISSEALGHVRVPQRLQRDKQAVFGDDESDLIPSQNVHQEPPNFLFLEGLESRFEGLWAEASSTMKLGEIKHFYMRRHKRVKQCFAPAEASLQMSDQKPFLADEMPDEAEEQKDAKDICLNLENKNLGLENQDAAIPNLDLSKSDPLQFKQVKNSTSQAKISARWQRELMQLVGNGQLFNEESTEMDNRDLLNTSRKRRRLQKIKDSAKGESENLAVKECTSTQSTTVLQQESRRKWRDVQLSTADPTQLIGCKCKVFWPEDKDWYAGVISGYNIETGIHHVLYDDGDKEDLILMKELVKLHLSDVEMVTQNLLEINELKRFDFQEMAALATVFEDFQEEFWHGELVWAKIKGTSTKKTSCCNF